tara:strand:+ start:287 stop:484 length:198 start_codon:yes stop_codon:yes gene_type:complete
MNDKDSLKEDLKNKINELKVLLDNLGNDLSEKKESFEESNELIEVLENYRLQILKLSDSDLNEEE